MNLPLIWIETTPYLSITTAFCMACQLQITGGKHKERRKVPKIQRVRILRLARMLHRRS